MMEEGYTTGFSGSAIIRSLQGQDPNGIKLGENHDFFDGFTLMLGLSSISCMYGYQIPIVEEVTRWSRP